VACDRLPGRCNAELREVIAGIAELTNANRRSMVTERRVI